MSIDQLSPDDAEMANIHKRYLSSISSRSGPSNALSNSVLMDDEPTSSSAGNDAAGAGLASKTPPEQRILLLQALLAIGDLPSSLLFLGRFPWVAQSHPAIADLIMQIVAHAVEDVYRDVAEKQNGLRDDDSDMDGHATVALVTPDIELVPTLLAPPPPATSAKCFEFFYHDWRDGLEKWSTPQDVLEKGPRWFSLVRGLGGRTVDVMVKICRIAAAQFAQLRRTKELEQGFQYGAKTNDENRLVAVSCCQFDYRRI